MPVGLGESPGPHFDNSEVHKRHRTENAASPQIIHLLDNAFEMPPAPCQAKPKDNDAHSIAYLKFFRELRRLAFGNTEMLCRLFEPPFLRLQPCIDQSNLRLIDP